MANVAAWRNWAHCQLALVQPPWFRLLPLRIQVMTTPLFTALARNATARAQLIGATGHCPRYWRELATAAHLLGGPWHEAERLGCR